MNMQRHRPYQDARSHPAPDPVQSQRIELLFLPGLVPVVEAEVREQLPDAMSLRRVAGRSDSILMEYGGPWERLLTLRTIVAPFLVLGFPVPRPRSLTSSEYFPQIVEAIRLVRSLNPDPAGSFHFDAAGASSAGYRQLAARLEDVTGMKYDPDEADIVLRFRRTAAGAEGWDVLVRLSARPLSRRPWRVRNFPGAINAAIAAAVNRLTYPLPSDRFANLMCGSGSLLIERLLACPAQVAVGVDNDARALAACAANLEAAGLRRRAALIENDVAEDAWIRRGPFDVMVADPPWGGLTGSHATNEALHQDLLERAHEAAAPGGRLAVVSHEIRIMERCLARVAGLWIQRESLRVFQKGHRPGIYILTKRDDPGANR